MPSETLLRGVSAFLRHKFFGWFERGVSGWSIFPLLSANLRRHPRAAAAPAAMQAAGYREARLGRH
jgi:hypothetical protein